ncbi:MAG: PKD domain-containing protein, partial [Chloroflexi bacterium]|nr:PKD domain-containing protein [Chloroflexota bacterium]MCI0725814.1 PKD domain-containing protein [Chloroflexota bacterium]
APTADAGPDQSVGEGDLVALAALVTDPGSNDSHTYLWQVTADNGQTIPNGTDQSFSFTPVDNGVYTVTLTVTDDDGGSDSDVALVLVDNAAPAANAGPDRVANEGQWLTISGSFTDPGGNDTHTYLWQVVASNGQVIPEFTTLNFTFTPYDNGVYTATLTVTDNDGDSGTDTAIITVNNVAPTTNAGPDQTATSNNLVTLDGSFTDPGLSDSHTFLWEVVASNGQNVPDGTDEDFSFTPTGLGVYTVTFTVTDDDSGSDGDVAVVMVSGSTLYLPIIIGAAPPTQASASPAPAAVGARCVGARCIVPLQFVAQRPGGRQVQGRLQVLKDGFARL